MSITKFDWDGRTLTFQTYLSKNFIEEMQRATTGDPDKEIQKIVTQRFTESLEQWMDERRERKEEA